MLSIQLVPQSTFFGDDYIQLGILEGTTEGFGAGPFDLYGFMDGSTEGVRKSMESGPVPWFVHPQLKVHFLRPVSSALLALDHAIFGLRPWGYRIQAILWYLLIVAVYGVWLRRMTSAAPRNGDGDVPGAAIGSATLLALFVFAVSDAHWVAVTWTAGRWVLVATALALTGCVAHLRWRQEGCRLSLLLSLITFALGFLAGELALAVLAYPVAVEIVAPRTKITERVRGLVPLALVAGAYLVIYKMLGRGAYGGAEYLDPSTDPLGYLVELPGKLLAMFGDVPLIHLALAPYRWVTGPIELRQSSESLAELVRSTPFVDMGVPDQRTIFLTVHFAACWNGYFLRRLERLPLPQRWWMLSAADAEHRYDRTAPDQFVLETDGGEMMATRLESMIRSRKAPIGVGYEVDMDGLRVRVLEVGHLGPTRVEFTFDRSLDDPSMVLMAVRDGRLQRHEPPPVGETLRLPSSW